MRDELTPYEIRKATFFRNELNLERGAILKRNYLKTGLQRRLDNYNEFGDDSELTNIKKQQIGQEINNIQTQNEFGTRMMQQHMITLGELTAGRSNPPDVIEGVILDIRESNRFLMNQGLLKEVR